MQNYSLRGREVVSAHPPFNHHSRVWMSLPSKLERPRPMHPHPYNAKRMSKRPIKNIEHPHP